jgi:hypothetical protein
VAFAQGAGIKARIKNQFFSRICLLSGGAPVFAKIDLDHEQKAERPHHV